MEVETYEVKSDRITIMNRNSRLIAGDFKYPFLNN